MRYARTGCRAAAERAGRGGMRLGQDQAPARLADDQVVRLDGTELEPPLPPEGQQGVRLGVSIASAKPMGAYAGRVMAESAAERAGIWEGDTIVEIAQQPVRGARDVHAILARLSPGERANITLRRKKRTLRLVVRL